MPRLLAATWKEILLLIRDRSGLLLLFAMPAVLVLVITLVQDNVTRPLTGNGLDVVFVDEDQGLMGQRMATALSDARGLVLQRTLDGAPPTPAQAIDAAVRGRIQVAVVIPAGTTAAALNSARHRAADLLGMTPEENAPTPVPGKVAVYFDPAMLGPMRSAASQMVDMMVRALEMELQASTVSEMLSEKLNRELGELLGPMAPAFGPSIDLTRPAAPLLQITADPNAADPVVPMPDAVQHNVPAWSLFGMFFIVLPLAGGCIKERLTGVQYRLLSLPVPYLLLVMGKMLAYMGVCLVQAALIVCIGKWVLPLLGVPPFQLSATPPAALALITLCAMLAATSYGVLLGTALRSYEQAAMFGPLSVVIAAALGGIMVPVFAMPQAMQRLSRLSPLSWAQDAYLDLFVRGGDMGSVAGNALALSLFALGCLAAAWVVFRRRLHTGAHLSETA